MRSFSFVKESKAESRSSLLFPQKLCVSDIARASVTDEGPCHCCMGKGSISWSERLNLETSCWFKVSHTYLQSHHAFANVQFFRSLQVLWQPKGAEVCIFCSWVASMWPSLCSVNTFRPLPLVKIICC